MTFKQTLKLISVIALIIATIGIFVPALLFGDDSNYSLFELTFKHQEFVFPLFLALLFTIFSLALSFLTISYDGNKIIPLLMLIMTLIAGIILLNTKDLSTTGMSKLAANQWKNATKIQFGLIIAVGGNLITALAMAIISFRAFILKIDDSVKLYDEETDDVEEIDDEEIDEPKQKDWLETLKENEEENKE